MQRKRRCELTLKVKFSVCPVGLVGVKRCSRVASGKAKEVGSCFLLFPAAGCFLTRISSLRVCSLYISPCSFLMTVPSPGDGRSVPRVPAWQLFGRRGNGRCGVFVAEFLLFPTAWCGLSRISSLFACSLCISPCSFFFQSNGWWLLLLSLGACRGVEVVCLLMEDLDVTVVLRDDSRFTPWFFHPITTHPLSSSHSAYQ
jgi:hypothetical protein